MEIEFKIQEAEQLKECPVCFHTLHNDGKSNTDLIFWSDIDKDYITHYQCPYCDAIFKRVF